MPPFILWISCCLYFSKYASVDVLFLLFKNCTFLCFRYCVKCTVQKRHPFYFRHRVPCIVQKIRSFMLMKQHYLYYSKMRSLHYHHICFSVYFLCLHGLDIFFIPNSLDRNLSPGLTWLTHLTIFPKPFFKPENVYSQIENLKIFT